jgi:hypothetical protein
MLVGVGLIFLGLIGRLGWLAALLGVLITFLSRSLPLLLHYGPALHRFWASLRNHNNKQSQYSTEANQPPRGKMTVAEAYQILGLKPPATKQEIVLAHKKLMQKMHPDRGGSDYLASQINLAKDLLLKN